MMSSNVRFVIEELKKADRSLLSPLNNPNFSIKARKAIRLLSLQKCYFFYYDLSFPAVISEIFSYRHMYINGYKIRVPYHFIISVSIGQRNIYFEVKLKKKRKYVISFSESSELPFIIHDEVYTQDRIQYELDQGFLYFDI
jgi:hypothetical protein